MHTLRCVALERATCNVPWARCGSGSPHKRRLGNLISNSQHPCFPFFPLATSPCGQDLASSLQPPRAEISDEGNCAWLATGRSVENQVELVLGQVYSTTPRLNGSEWFPGSLIASVLSLGGKSKQVGVTVVERRVETFDFMVGNRKRQKTKIISVSLSSISLAWVLKYLHRVYNCSNWL